MSDLFDLPFEDAPPPAQKRGPRHVFTVRELTVDIRDRLEGAYGEIWVEGELTGCRSWNGHLYFALKDDTTQIRGVIFRLTLRYVRFKPHDGLRVVARGRVSVYEPKGEYQLVCEHLEPQGLGALQLALEQLKKRLLAEGLFAADRKRALPALPRKIGVVTSLDGAVVHDIIQVLRRRYANAHIVIRAARVQGDGAAADIARGVRAIAEVAGVDVVIVARGGGSAVDLWAFNEEPVVRAIAGCPVPVVSAVGHEVDVTLADLVADLRAPTPSAAAELVVAAKAEFEQRIALLTRRARSAWQSRVAMLARRVHTVERRSAFAAFPSRLALRGRDAADLSRELAGAIEARLAERRRVAERLRQRLDRWNPGHRLAVNRARMAAADGRLAAVMVHTRHAASAALGRAAAQLESLNPLAVLARGYAVAWDGDKRHALRQASSVRPGDIVHVTLNDGSLTCQVQSTTDDAHTPIAR